VRGAPVDWPGFDTDYARRRLALPTYPFQHERYWLETTAKPPFARNGHRPHGLHPLLGERLRSPLKEIQFEARLTATEPAYLADHRVYEAIVFPAAAYLEMALAAVAATNGDQRHFLETVVIQEALTLSPQAEKSVQVILLPEEQGRASFQIVSVDTDGVWTQHASGQLGSRPITPPGVTLDVPTIQARCHDQLTGADFYEHSAQVGFQFGATFRGVQHVWRCSGEALALVELPPQLVSDTAPYQIHPVLLDACLQIFGAAATEPYEQAQAYVPVGVNNLHFYRRPGSRLWSHVTVRAGASAQAEALTLDYRVFDETHELVFEVEGLHVRRVDSAALLKTAQHNLLPWLHEIVWRPQARREAAGTDSGARTGHWLLFADQGGFGRAVADLLRAQANTVSLVFPGDATAAWPSGERTIDPTDPEAFVQLVADIQHANGWPLQGIVYLWALEADDPLAVQQRVCGGLLHLVQALARPLIASRPRLWLVTRGAQPVPAGSTAPAVAQAPLWGLGAVIAQELPHLWCGRVDLDPAGVAGEAQALFNELWSSDREDQVAFRQQARYVARLVRHAAPTPAGSKPGQAVAIHADSTYLVAGGFGGLGLLVAEWLVAKGARHLLLAGRSGAVGPAEERVAALRQQGVRVLAVQADIAQEADVLDLLQQAADHLPPIRGIVHVAGIVQDGALVNQTWSQFALPLAPKIAGGWHLHTLTQAHSLDFFVLFSSMASLLGSPGQGSYTAANAFLDALAHWRRAHGLPGTSINWGPWAEVGMAARADSRGDRRWTRHGIGKISPRQGLQVLEMVLAHELSQIGVIPVDWTRFLQQFPAQEAPPLYTELTAVAQVVELQVVNRSALLHRLGEAPAGERRTILRRHIQEHAARILGMTTPQSLDPETSVYDLGLDSLMGVEFTRVLEATTGHPLPATLLFNYPTVEALAEFLEQELTTLAALPPPVVEESDSHALDEILQEVEALSEEEMDAILATLGEERHSR
ncbi:MAG: type I polyketide synthase, partial [Chloroflexi bacterium]|nr:type I polyketide synthase [Chloroflexota bacterium]